MESNHPVDGGVLAQQEPPKKPQTMVEKYGFNIDESLATSYVGKYTLYHTIGEGAFGKVKVAVSKASGEVFAIKIMDKRQILKQDFTSQVRREIYIMRSLKHKHIVRMHEVLSSESKLYIVMDYVRGGELFHHLEKNGRVDEAKARLYFQQLVDGVDFCHRSGVAHRDLKPENILLDENGNIRITDFGFSSMRGVDVNSDLLHTQCGTPDYCAPEIIECTSKGYSGAKVDAWSCGIILYALLAGRLPFVEQDTEKLYDLILACQVDFPKFISPQARDLLERLLVRNPTNRFDLQAVKQHPWFLVDYDGDDARLLKKRPFFNKNNQKSLASAPSTPAVPETPTTPSVNVPNEPSPLKKVEPISASRPDPPVDRPYVPPEAPVPPPEPEKQFFNKAVHRPNGIESSPARTAQSVALAREPSPQKRPEPFLPYPPAHEPTPSQSTPQASEFDDEDNASDGGDSVEDYTEKPVPALELPIEPLSLNRSRPAQSERPRSHAAYPHLAASRSQQPLRMQKSDQLPAQRHRSDVSEASRPFSYAIPNGESVSMSALSVPRRAFASGAPNGTREPRGFRHVRGADTNPNSPHYSSIPNGSPSPAYLSRPHSNGGTPDYGSGSYGNGRVVPDAVGSSRVTPYATKSNANMLQTEVTARHIWSIVNKWRGTTEPVSPSSSMDILSDFRVLMSEITNLRAEEKGVVLERFLALFEAFGLADIQSRQSVMTAIQRHRHRIPSGDVGTDNDEDSTYDDASNHAGESRQHSIQSSHRRPATDISSEEETLSWSPVLADSQRQQSDLARRREMSDLLNRWILRTNPGPGQLRAGSMPLPQSAAEDNEVVPTSMDIQELQRLMRQHQSGREESNLADELIRLVHNEQPGADDGGSVFTASASAPGQSPSMRSVENQSLNQSLTRWHVGPHSGMPKSRGIRPPSSSHGRLHSDFSHNRYGDSQGTLPSVHDGYSQGDKSSASVGNSSDTNSYALMTQSTASAAINNNPNNVRTRSRRNMATSMGMHDVEYYGPEKKNGIATKFLGALLTVKVRNQNLAENLTKFKSKLPVEEIIRIMVGILQNIGATVTLKKETRRKLKCRILRHDDSLLCAAVEFQSDGNGQTTVIFKRSKEDKNRTDVSTFHEFYEKVRELFIAEVQNRYDRNPAGGGAPKRRRSPRYIGSSFG